MEDNKQKIFTQLLYHIYLEYAVSKKNYYSAFHMSEPQKCKI